MASLGAFLVALSLSSPALAQEKDKATPYTVGLQLVASRREDAAITRQVTRLFVQVLEQERKFRAHGYFKPKKKEEQARLARLLDAGIRKLSPAILGNVYLEGKKEIDEAFLMGRRLLAELSPALVGDLYRGMGMVQAMGGNLSLAAGYWMTFLNLSPKESRTSRMYHKRYLELFDKAQERYEEDGKYQVTLTVKPEGARVTLDGELINVNDSPFELWSGGHLIQVEKEGYYRGGWVKDPSLHGVQWKLTLAPIESRPRQVEYVKRLEKTYSQEASTPSDEVRRWLYDLRAIFESDALLFLVVSANKDTVLLRGAFVSSYDAFSLERTLPRDATILDGVRQVILEVTDIEGQKDTAARREAKQEHEELAKWGASLSKDLASTREQLLTKGQQWVMAGEGEKRFLFVKTAGVVADLSADLTAQMQHLQEDPKATRVALGRINSQWLRVKVKADSLLSWDVDKALQDKEISQIGEVLTQARKRIKEARQRFKAGRREMSRKEAAGYDRALRRLEKGERTLTKAAISDRSLGRNRPLLYEVAWKSALFLEQLSKYSNPMRR